MCSWLPTYGLVTLLYVLCLLKSYSAVTDLTLMVGHR